MHHHSVLIILIFESRQASYLPIDNLVELDSIVMLSSISSINYILTGQIPGINQSLKLQIEKHSILLDMISFN